METPKDFATKREEAHVRTELYDHANFNADRREICPRAKKYIKIYFIADSPGATVPCYTFLERFRRADFKL